VGASQGECASLELSVSAFSDTVVADVARARVSCTASETLLLAAPSFQTQIKEAVTSLNVDTSEVEQLVQTHTDKLKLAKSTHVYLDDCSDLHNRLSSLAKRLGIEDVGTTVVGAQRLLEDVGTIEHDLTALQPAIQSAVVTGADLSNRPLQHLTSDITERSQALETLRASITSAIGSRRVTLNHAIELFDYEDQCRDFETWDRGMLQAIAAEKPVESVEDAAVVMQRHQSRLREISAGKDTFGTLQTDGKGLVAAHHPASDKVRSPTLILS
jgi:hypothetical protein